MSHRKYYRTAPSKKQCRQMTSFGMIRVILLSVSAFRKNRNLIGFSNDDSISCIIKVLLDGSCSDCGPQTTFTERILPSTENCFIISCAPFLYVVSYRTVPYRTYWCPTLPSASTTFSVNPMLQYVSSGIVLVHSSKSLGG